MRVLSTTSSLCIARDKLRFVVCMVRWGSRSAESFHRHFLLFVWKYVILLVLCRLKKVHIHAVQGTVLAEPLKVHLDSFLHCLDHLCNTRGSTHLPPLHVYGYNPLHSRRISPLATKRSCFTHVRNMTFYRGPSTLPQRVRAYLNSLEPTVDRRYLENNKQTSMDAAAWAVHRMSRDSFFRRPMDGIRRSEEASQHFTVRTQGLLQHLNTFLAMRAVTDSRLQGVQFVVAGGCALRSVVDNMPAYSSLSWSDGDVDVYILAPQLTSELPALMMEVFHGAIGAWQQCSVCIVEVPSDRAMNYHLSINGTSLLVQLITKIFLHPLDIVGWYDLSCCQVLHMADRFLLTEAAWNAIRTG